LFIWTERAREREKEKERGERKGVRNPVKEKATSRLGIVYSHHWFGPKSRVASNNRELQVAINREREREELEREGA